jgi:hypothetical protein
LHPIGFSDSSHTGDGKYVVASFLNLPELKYRDYAPRKQHVASKLPLQRAVNRGLSEAELTVIDRPKYLRSALWEFMAQGAELNYDFGLGDLENYASNEMLLDSPFGLSGRAFDYSAFLAFNRPAFRDRLFELFGPEFEPLNLSLLRERAGGKPRDIVVLSARAHSMFSPTEHLELLKLVDNPYSNRSWRGNLERISKLVHVFDTEHSKSLPLLNELVNQVADVSLPPHLARFTRLSRERLPVTERSSSQSDHIQASDFAAGWAVDLLVSTDGDYRALAQKVRWVTVNGVAVPA